MAPELALPTSEVRGPLSGEDRNHRTSCTSDQPTNGPEQIYRLQLRERTLVDMEIESTTPTVIAIRSACETLRTERACGVSAPTSDPSSDSLPMAPGRSQMGRLRQELEAGTYFVLVDEVGAIASGGQYLLRVRSGRAIPGASCDTAIPVQSGTVLPHEPQFTDAEPAPSCIGTPTLPSAFYRASIPAGQRLTVVIAVPFETWTPVLQLHSGCDAGVCLATTEPDSAHLRVLRYDNRGTSAQDVVLAVRPLRPISSGNFFQLDVRIADPSPNRSCAAARPLFDGILRAQDLNEAPTGADGCKPAGSRALSYVATLLPHQSLQARAQTADGRPFGGLDLVLRRGCADTTCTFLGAGYTNPGPGSRTVILDVRQPSAVPVSPFDLVVSMPPPPAGVVVNAPPVLQTSEGGQHVSFEVGLASPPAEVVTLPIESSDPAEGTPSPAVLTFDPSSWQTPQTVRITGVDDVAPDGARRYEVRIGPAQGGDKRYTALPASVLSVINRDDEPGFYMEGRTPLVTSESEDRATFKVALNRRPTATVRLPFGSSDAGEAIVMPSELVFEPDNWDRPQTVALVGVDDQEKDGSQSYRVVVGPAASGDPAYAGLDPEDLTARNGDNEFEQTEPQVLRGPNACERSREPGTHIAADPDGNLFVTLACQRPSGAQPAPTLTGNGAPEPGIFLAASLDAGQSFRPAVDTGLSGSRVAVAATARAVVVATTDSEGTLRVARSETGGATWQAAVRLGAGGNTRLAAAGELVVLTAQTTVGPALWVSQDAAATFQSVPRPSRGYTLGMGIDRSTGAVWLASFEESLIFRVSHDGAATFGSPAVVDTRLSDAVVAGPATIFSTSNGRSTLVALGRDGTKPREVPGLVSFTAVPRALLADHRDNLVVLEHDSAALMLRRLPSGATEFLPARSFSSHASASGVVLSESAIAVTWMHSAGVLVSVQRWP